MPIIIILSSCTLSAIAQYACSDGSINTAYYLDSSATEHTFVTTVESVITTNKSVSISHGGPLVYF